MPKPAVDVVRTAGRWRIVSDGIQWILQRCKPSGLWVDESYVRSERAILVRCAREHGATSADIAALTAGLPATFDQWMARSAA